MTDTKDRRWIRYTGQGYPDTDGQLTCTFNIKCRNSHEAYGVWHPTDVEYQGEAACLACLAELKLEP